VCILFREKNISERYCCHFTVKKLLVKSQGGKRITIFSARVNSKQAHRLLIWVNSG
jgi:hypothetical protein